MGRDSHIHNNNNYNPQPQAAIASNHAARYTSDEVCSI